MNFCRAWWLKRNGVCPVHLVALTLYTSSMKPYEYWGSCPECVTVRGLAEQKRIDDKRARAEALAAIERNLSAWSASTK